MTKNLNKVVLITGAARRIGSQMARTFHAAGFNVILHYHLSRNEAKKLRNELENKRKNSTTLIELDLLAENNWDDIIRSCQSQWGRLDVLINNASTFYPTHMGEVTEDQWNDLIGTNLKAPFFFSQAIAPSLKEVAGCIINIIDIHASRPLKYHPVYSIAKAGLVMMTHSLAKELAPEVRVNGISPGTILWPENQSELTEKTRATIIRQIPLKRQGSPEDIANTALFLATDAPYINGQIIAVDGGRSLS
ncbi:MAG: pteridine reductase [Gammaproteobacteria bacterium]|nr:pteridine reductase [Gammaproteobacteria bacterium]